MKKTILPRVSESKDRTNFDFVLHAEDRSTWATWQLAIRSLSVPFGIRSSRIFPINVSKEYLSTAYHSAEIAILVKAGCTHPGLIAKRLGISVVESIRRIKECFMVKEEGGKLILSRDLITEYDSLVDPRVSIILYNARRGFMCLTTRMYTWVDDKKSFQNLNDDWRTHYRNEVYTKEGEDLAYACLKDHIVKNNRLRYILGYSKEKDRYGIVISNSVYNRKTFDFDVVSRVSSLYLKKSKLPNGDISFILGRDGSDHVIDEVSWFSDTDRVERMFINEYDKAEEERHPRKVEFNNSEICCPS